MIILAWLLLQPTWPPREGIFRPRGNVDGTVGTGVERVALAAIVLTATGRTHFSNDATCDDWHVNLAADKKADADLQRRHWHYDGTERDSECKV